MTTLPWNVPSRGSPLPSAVSRDGGQEPAEPADVVLHYGQLAAELEEATDPSRRRKLRGRLAELDAWLDEHLGRDA